MLTEKKTIGNFGEQLARDFLIRHGYRIIDSNKKIGHREIDIIAKTGFFTVFVEVKTLANNRIPAEEALTRHQIRILKKTISSYCYSYRLPTRNTRLDFISINIDRKTKVVKIRHYPNIY